MPLAALTWQALSWLPIALIAGVLGFVLTWWLYNPQVRLRSRGLRWGLPLLRSIAIAVLVAALLKPVVLRQRSTADQGTLLVLVDHSDSMNVVDSRTPSQLVALADGLKLLPAGAAKDLSPITRDDIDQLKAQVDKVARAASELDYAKLAGRGVEAAQQRQDDSIAEFVSLAQGMLARAKTRPKLTRMIDRLSQLAVAPAAKDRDAWLRDVRGRVDRLGSTITESENTSAEQLLRDSPAVKAACERVAKLSRFGLAQLAVKQALGPPDGKSLAVYDFAGEVESPDSHATGDRSDLTGSVRNVLAKYPRDSVRSVVLLSDGRQTSGSANVDALAAAASGVAVNTVRLAPPSPPRDLAIARVNLPQRAFVGETVNVRVDVRSTGIRGEIPVQLHCGEISQNKPVAFVDDGTMTAEFPIKLDKPGPATVSVSVPSQPIEISTDNNSATRSFQVLQDKVHVVAIAQSAGRDFQFLHDALQRTAWIKWDEAIATTPDGTVTPSQKLIESADLLVIEDGGTKLLPPNLWEAVRKTISERGAGALVLAGLAHEPGNLLGQPDAAQLLPFASAEGAKWRTWAGEYPMLRAVPAEADLHAARLPEALRLTDDADSSLRRWQELPAMYRLMQITQLKPNATALLVDAETHAAVMTDSRVGAGHVVYVGMTETWRCAYKIGQRDQDRFWLQLVRQAADEPYAATAGGVSIDADRTTAEPGKPIRLRVRLRDANGQASADPQVRLSIKSSNGSTQTDALPAIAPGSGRYEKTVNTWPVGTYQVSVEGKDSPSITIQVQRNGEAEMQNLSGDDRFLRRIADATGGQCLAPEQLPDLPAQLAAEAREHPQMAETRLWDSPYLFAFVLACLGLEWAVRKQAGLA